MSSIEHQIGTTKNASDSIDYQNDWIIDSGCSHHATGNDWLLSDIHPRHGRRIIVTADNSLHPVVKEGNFDVQSDNFTSNVSLKDVYHVPGLKKNLASVSQLADPGRLQCKCDTLACSLGTCWLPIVAENLFEETS
ncbi:hypothetical protein ABFS83_04G137000 [Erythranthe nasuta]